MKTTLKFIILFCLVGQFQTVEAQLLKRLKNKIENKVEQKIEQKLDREIDKTIDGVGDKQPKQNGRDRSGDSLKKTNQNGESNETYGSTILTHSQKYESIQIDEISQVKVIKTNEGYKINGNWWSHDADILDGFFLTINTSEILKQDEQAYKKGSAYTFKIPEEAQLKLGYDPELPYYKPVGDDNRKQAVTDAYQNVEISKGSVNIDVLTEGAIQISFSGKVSLRQVTRHSDNSEDFTESYFESTLIGAVDAISPLFIDNTSLKKAENTNQNSGEYAMPQISNTASKPGVYEFTFETVVEVTNPEEDKTFKMSYLLNPNETYMAMKMDMGDYTDEEMDGESLMVMDGEDVHIFVETSGMKMLMSQSMMDGKQTSNPSEQMADYDYSGLTKTGKTKTILGAKCYEYEMSDKDTKINFWVAPEISLPNWFIQNKEVLEGYIMEYTVISKDGNIKSETIAIKDNINITINPKEYRKMF